MARDTLNMLSLCSGVGGLDLGVELATGGAARVVCHVEREAFAAAILAARMEDETVARAPVWSDLRTFDGRPWRGVVDCVVGGYPCQPFSFAGKRGGENDPRHLWPEVARIVAEVEPGIVFFENVGGHLSLGFDDVSRDLHRMGYRVTAGLFTASEVGGSHKRERLFILGVADGARGGCGELWSASGGGGCAEQDRGDVDDAASSGHEPTGQRQQVESQRRGSLLGARCDDVVHPAHVGHQRGGRGGSADAGGSLVDPISKRRRGGDQRCDATDVDASGGTALADADGLDDRKPQAGGRDGAGGLAAGSSGALADASNGLVPLAGRGPQGRDGLGPAGASLPVFPPGPGSRAEWERILRDRPDLAPAVEPRVRGVADGLASRLDRLRACGNGVVSLVAAYAFVSLWACLREE